MKTTLLGSAALIAALAVPAWAQDNLGKLQGMQSTGAPLRMDVVPQADSAKGPLTENLKNITLPEGFEIELYAVVPDARHMAVGPSTGVVFVGTRKADAYAVTDRNKDRVADEVKRLAASLGDLTVPNGMCMTPDGFLYMIEHNRVLMFPAAEFFYESPDMAVAEIVPQGELIPVEEESFNHGARVCAIGPDNKLYIALGQPYNVPPKEKMDLYNEVGIGGIIRVDRDGSNREVYTRGVRNSVGMDFNPANGELWWTDNQVDGMGDDIPPGEINRQTEAGQNFGFPWYGGGDTRTNEYADEEVPEGVVFPASETVAHAADLGMVFNRSDRLPEKYRGGIFSAQHGSWNRTTPVGARVMFTPINEDGSAGETEVFAEGWLNEDGEYLGRPVDVAQLPDGSLLVSDDFAGAIYRIAYTGDAGGSAAADAPDAPMEATESEDALAPPTDDAAGAAPAPAGDAETGAEGDPEATQ